MTRFWGVRMLEEEYDTWQATFKFNFSGERSVHISLLYSIKRQFSVLICLIVSQFRNDSLDNEFYTKHLVVIASNLS